MTNDKPKVVVITGPTASGKSALAVELALYFGGEILNADSMAVYRGMDVGTAKPTIVERRDVPHYLLDVVNPDEHFDAAKYRSLAVPQLQDAASRGNPKHRTENWFLQRPLFQQKHQSTRQLRSHQ